MTHSTDSSNLISQHEVKVCTGSCLFSGLLKCDDNQRLIDAINEGVLYGASAHSVRFLPLSKADVVDSKGEKKKFSDVYISKGDIIFLARGENEMKGRKLSSYPYKEKIAQRVTISAGQYTIRGHVHIDTWGQLPDTIESELNFFPVTEVEIFPALFEGEHRFDFVAVNRDKITYICRED
jgi:hypothetical protein